MPLYEYECPRCHTTTEHLLSYQEVETIVIKCVECKVKCKKQISWDFSTNDPKTVGRAAELNSLREKGLCH